MTGVATWADLTPDTSTLAGSKAVWKNLSDRLQSLGLVKTADTGQIDLVSGSWTPTINTPAGYEIYRLDDSLHSTKPVYIKIEYGYGAATNRPNFWLTVGAGSNGAGTIVNQMLSRTAQLGIATSSSGLTSYTSYLSVQEGFVGLMWLQGWSTTNKGNLFFSIERSRDASGNITGDGVYVVASFSTPATMSAAHCPYPGPGVALVQTNVGCMVPQVPASSTYDSNVQMYRHYVSCPRLRNTVGLLTYVHAEFSAGLAALVDVTVLGVARTYLPLGQTGMSGGEQSATNTPYAIAMWWDD